MAYLRSDINVKGDQQIACQYNKVTLERKIAVVFCGYRFVFARFDVAVLVAGFVDVEAGLANELVSFAHNCGPRAIAERGTFAYLFFTKCSGRFARMRFPPRPLVSEQIFPCSRAGIAPLSCGFSDGGDRCDPLRVRRSVCRLRHRGLGVLLCFHSHRVFG